MSVSDARTDAPLALPAAVWFRAALAGLAGAVVMAMWAMMAAAVMGRSLFAPVQLIAAVWYGPAAMHLTAHVLLAGLATHMMVGIVLGMMLALAFAVGRIVPGPVRLAWGMGFGLAAWLVSQFAVLPALDPLMAQNMAIGVFALGHVMFGVVTAWMLLRTPGAA